MGKCKFDWETNICECLEKKCPKKIARRWAKGEITIQQWQEFDQLREGDDYPDWIEWLYAASRYALEHDKEIIAVSGIIQHR